jgi:hypothetical protein
MSGCINTKKSFIDVNDQPALEKFLQGKWSWDRHSGSINETRRYRFEIVESKMRLWHDISNVKDAFDMKVYEEYNYHLGEPVRDVDGYHCRYLIINEFSNQDISLDLRNVLPIWIVADSAWDNPVVRCSGGMPSWSRDNFTSNGTKRVFNHEFRNTSNNENTNETSSKNGGGLTSKYDGKMLSDNYHTNGQVAFIPSSAKSFSEAKVTIIYENENGSNRASMTIKYADKKFNDLSLNNTASETGSDGLTYDWSIKDKEMIDVGYLRLEMDNVSQSRKIKVRLLKNQQSESRLQDLILLKGQFKQSD